MARRQRCVCGNASGYSARWIFACANPDRCLPMPIRWPRRHIKKLRQLANDPQAELWPLDEVHFQQYGS